MLQSCTATKTKTDLRNDDWLVSFLDYSHKPEYALEVTAWIWCMGYGVWERNITGLFYPPKPKRISQTTFVRIWILCSRTANIRKSFLILLHCQFCIFRTIMPPMYYIYLPFFNVYLFINYFLKFKLNSLKCD